MDGQWLQHNLGLMASLLGQHAALALLPVLAALVISLPLGVIVFRAGRAANALLAVLGLAHSVPALALLVIVPLLLRLPILDPVNVVVVLTLSSVARLVRSVVEGLRSVTDTVTRSADAAGFGRFRRLLRVELPLAMPAVFSGLRLVTVSNIALVTIAVLVSSGGLGQLVRSGYESTRYTPLIAGLVLTVLLAVVADTVIRLVGRGTLPWARVQPA